jgi:hypothetical protein
MSPECHKALNQLRDGGWRVNLCALPRELPWDIKNRFAWIPEEIEEFASELETAVSSDATIWLLGAADFYGSSQSAYRWNDWEQMSLDAAEGNATLTTSIRFFWNNHFPIAISVKSGYAYFAVRKADFGVVCGEEPEFDETSPIASSFSEFINLLAKRDPKLARWM